MSVKHGSYLICDAACAKEWPGKSNASTGAYRNLEDCIKWARISGWLVMGVGEELKTLCTEHAEEAAGEMLNPDVVV